MIRVIYVYTPPNFFLYNFSYKTRISTTQYKTSVIKTKTDVYAFGIVISGY